VVRLVVRNIVHAFPAVAAVREAFPGGKMYVDTLRWRELVASTGIANEIWEVETAIAFLDHGNAKEDSREGFSAATDYQGCGSPLRCILARVPRRIGFSSASVREFGVPCSTRISRNSHRPRGRHEWQLSFASGKQQSLRESFAERTAGGKNAVLTCFWRKACKNTWF